MTSQSLSSPLLSHGLLTFFLSADFLSLSDVSNAFRINKITRNALLKGPPSSPLHSPLHGVSFFLSSVYNDFRPFVLPMNFPFFTPPFPPIIQWTSHVKIEIPNESRLPDDEDSLEEYAQWENAMRVLGTLNHIKSLSIEMEFSQWPMECLKILFTHCQYPPQIISISLINNIIGKGQQDNSGIFMDFWEEKINGILTQWNIRTFHLTDFNLKYSIIRLLKGKESIENIYIEGNTHAVSSNELMNFLLQCPNISTFRFPGYPSLFYNAVILKDLQQKIQQNLIFTKIKNLHFECIRWGNTIDLLNYLPSLNELNISISNDLYDEEKTEEGEGEGEGEREGEGDNIMKLSKFNLRHLTVTIIREPTDSSWNSLWKLLFRLPFLSSFTLNFQKYLQTKNFIEIIPPVSSPSFSSSFPMVDTLILSNPYESLLLLYAMCHRHREREILIFPHLTFIKIELNFSGLLRQGRMEISLIVEKMKLGGMPSFPSLRNISLEYSHSKTLNKYTEENLQRIERALLEGNKNNLNINSIILRGAFNETPLRFGDFLCESLMASGRLSSLKILRINLLLHIDKSKSSKQSSPWEHFQKISVMAHHMTSLREFNFRYYNNDFYGNLLTFFTLCKPFGEMPNLQDFSIGFPEFQENHLDLTREDNENLLPLISSLFFSENHFPRLQFLHLLFPFDMSMEDNWEGGRLLNKRIKEERPQWNFQKYRLVH